MDTLRHRIEHAKAQLRLQAQRVAVGMAQTGLALVTLRIQREGLPGRRYSTRPVPTFWFKGKELNATGRAYTKNNRTGTWGEFRQAQGLRGDTINLTYSGRMFRSLQPVPTGSTSTTASATIVSSEAESAKVLRYNLREYGNFLEPNAREKQQIDAYAKQQLDRIIIQALTQ